jgi:hypothetical protein
MRCDKKRAAVLPRCIFVAESALSKFIRIFRDNDAHRSNALIDCRNFKVESGIATEWHKLHITPARSRTTLQVGTADDARERPDLQSIGKKKRNWQDRDRTLVRNARQEWAP